MPFTQSAIYVCEKYRNAQKNLRMVFIDLKKAYDRVPREICGGPLEKNVPEKYVRLIRVIYSRCSTQIRFTTGTTSSLNVAVGLHHESALSP